MTTNHRPQSRPYRQPQSQSQSQTQTRPQSQPVYRYFVSFAHGDGTMGGFGNAEIPLNTPITSHSNVCEIEQWLKGQGVRRPTVLHFIPLFAETPQ